jgi:hypothetical protein
MAAQTTNLFLLEDLENASKTSEIREEDLAALRSVGSWIQAFISKPHSDLGRPGPVCPFVPSALAHKELWLAPERIADQATTHVVELMQGYRDLFRHTPVDDADPDSKVIVVVFTDLPADHAQGVFDAVLGELAVPSYADAGNLFGPFYKGNEGTAIYNSNFRPFQSPVPFLFVRGGVVSDWKFFLDNEEMLGLWARRFGESGTQALADEVRRLPWRANPPQSA